MKLALSQIRIDGDTQPRASIDETWLDYLAESPVELPPLVVFHDGKHYWLADGFHRYHVHARKNTAKIDAKILKGTKKAAQWYAAGANRLHGKPMTTADKQSAIKMLLETHPEKSSRQIAAQVGVSHHTVENARESKEISSSGGQFAHLRQGADGKKYPPKKEKEAEQIPLSESRVDPPADDEPINTAVPTSEVKDGTGRLITDLELISTFNRAKELEDLARQVSDIKSLVTRAMKQEDELFAEFNLSQFQADCGNVYRAIRFAMPYAVCRYCPERGNKSCKACRGRGWTGEAIYKATPEEMK